MGTATRWVWPSLVVGLLLLVAGVAFVVIKPRRDAAVLDHALLRLRESRVRMQRYHEETGRWPQQLAELAPPVCREVCVLTRDELSHLGDVVVTGRRLCIEAQCLELDGDGGVLPVRGP
ncbi:MAG: hypothetical protein SFW67_12315 [Myxococcaceae bacterium]|nr:hypothetical protein [Myxococcaceae bacterium]